jgi:hypothetical protein
MSTNKANRIPKEIAELRRDWHKMHNIWTIMYYGFGVIGLLASALGTFLPEPLNRICAVISTICFGLIMFLKPQAHSIKYGRAWMILDTACDKYINGSYDIRKLDRDKARAEKIIAEMDEISTADQVPDTS